MAPSPDLKKKESLQLNLGVDFLGAVPEWDLHVRDLLREHWGPGRRGEPRR